MSRSNGILAASVIVSCILHYYLAFHVTRDQTIALISAYLALFIPYVLALKSAKLKWKNLLGIAFIFRIIWLFAIPEFTDDFYRFFWDAKLSLSGNHPFNYLPSQLPAEIKSAAQLPHYVFNLMNSPNYFTVYPPLLQGLFAASASLAGNDVATFVVVAKGINLLIEFAGIMALIQVAKHFRIAINKVAIYLLNPLIIVELFGNLHYEIVMISCTFLTIWAITFKKPIIAALFIALAISSKLYPILFIPILTFMLKGKNRWIFIVLSGLFSLAIFGLYFNLEQLMHMRQSVKLYFEHFEFNASIYYLVSYLGLKLGAVLGVFAMILITWFWFKNWRKQDYPKAIGYLSLIIAAYYFFATTVMPWYVGGILAFSVFGNKRFAIIWSALAIVSYSHYTKMPVAENYWLISLEYVLVLAWILVETKKPINKLFELSKKEETIP
ncbi:MAG: hypothetical protein KDC92_11010 [Bacteroidetes bacterium]|nr:hypothetical protein [Bacteroidota bacterium]